MGSSLSDLKLISLLTWYGQAFLQHLRSAPNCAHGHSIRPDAAITWSAKQKPFFASPVRKGAQALKKTPRLMGCLSNQQAELKSSGPYS